MFLERDSVESVVMAQWSAVIGEPPLSLDEDFFEDAGADSFRAVLLVERLRQAFASEVSVSLLFDNPTVRGLGVALREGGARHQRVMPFRVDGDGLPLVVLPNTAGNLVGLGRFADDVFHRPVYGLQSLGFMPSEPQPLRTMAAIVGDLADTLGKAGIGERCHLAGYCIGGIFAYELAQELRDRGWDIASVILLNTSLDAHEEPYEALYRQRVTELARLGGLEDIPSTAEALFERLSGGQLDIVERESASFARRVEIFVSNWYASARHEVSPHDIRTVLISTPDRLGKGDAQGMSGRLDWTELLPGLDVHQVSVGHYELMKDTGSLELIERLARHADPGHG